MTTLSDASDVCILPVMRFLLLEWKKGLPVFGKSLVTVMYSVRAAQPAMVPCIYYAGNRQKQANGMTGRFQKTWQLFSPVGGVWFPQKSCAGDWLARGRRIAPQEGAALLNKPSLSVGRFLNFSCKIKILITPLWPYLWYNVLCVV